MITDEQLKVRLAECESCLERLNATARNLPAAVLNRARLDVEIIRELIELRASKTQTKGIPEKLEDIW